MYTGINFLKERNRVQELTLIRDKRIATITSVILGVFLFAAVSLLVYQLFLNAQLNNLTTATLQKQQQLTGLSGTQSTYVGITKKIATIKQIIAKRGNKWGAITFFYGLLPPGATISSVDLQADVADSLSFSIAASNVFTYEQLSRILQSDVVKGSGFMLDLGTLSRTKDSVYRMEITLTTQAPKLPKGVSAK